MAVAMAVSVVGSMIAGVREPGWDWAVSDGEGVGPPEVRRRGHAADAAGAAPADTHLVAATAPTVAARERLQRERTAWLCTLRADGSPHLTPVWFCFLDEAWWVCSATRNRKVAHVRTDPRVSIALPDGDRPLVAEGTAHLLHGEFPEDVVVAFAERHGWDITDDGPEGPLALLRIPVTRWLLAG